MSTDKPQDEIGQLMEVKSSLESPTPKEANKMPLALRTLCIYLGFMCLGLCDSVLGPTFADMQTLLSTDTARLSAVFTATNLGYLGGSAAAGLLFDRLPAEPQLALALGVAAVAIAAAPAQRGLVTFVIAMAIEGAGLAYVDAGTQAYCLSVWRGHRLQDAVVQGIFMVWSVGSTVGPLILRPFLSSSQLQNRTTQGTTCLTHAMSTTIIANMTASNITASSDVYLNDEQFDSTKALERNPDLSVGFGYMVIGIILVPVSLLYVAAFFMTRSNKTEKADKEKVDCPSHGAKKLSVKEMFLISIFSLFFLVYVGLEVSVGGFLALFVRRALCWTNQQSAALTSLFWSCTGIGRLLGVPISIYLKPVHMLVMNLVLSTAGLLVLATLVEGQPSVVWGVAVTTGLGVSTVFPSAYLWCSRYVRVTGRVTGAFNFGGSVGSMILPLVTGILIDSINPWTFTQLMLASSVMLLVILFIIWVYVSRHMELITEETDQPVGNQTHSDGSYVTERLTLSDNKEVC